MKKLILILLFCFSGFASDGGLVPIGMSADDNFVTDAEKVVIGNTSGTNTGDNATNSQYSGLVSNANHTGDVTGSTALTIAASRIYASMLSSTNAAVNLYTPNYNAATGKFTWTAPVTASSSSAEIGYIRGYKITYKDANEIYYSDGEVEVNGTLVTNTTASTAFELTTTTTLTFYYIFINSSGTVTYSSTAPTWSATLHGWYTSTTRCIGVVWTTGTNTLANFTTSGSESEIEYCTYTYISKQVEAGAPTGSWIALSTSSDFVPVNATQVKVYCYEQDTSASCAIYVSADEKRTIEGDMSLASYNSIQSTGFVQLGASRDIAWNGNNDDDDASYVYIQGFKYER